MAGSKEIVALAALVRSFVSGAELAKSKDKKAYLRDFFKYGTFANALVAGALDSSEADEFVEYLLMDDRALREVADRTDGSDTDLDAYTDGGSRRSE